MSQIEVGTSNIEPGISVNKGHIYNAGQISLMTTIGWRLTKIAKTHPCCGCQKESPAGNAMWRREWATPRRRHNYEYACETCHIIYADRKGVTPVEIKVSEFIPPAPDLRKPYGDLTRFAFRFAGSFIIVFSVIWLLMYVLRAFNVEL